MNRKNIPNFNKKAANNFLSANKIYQDREYILQTSLLTALEVLKNDFGYTESQLQLYSSLYVDRLKDKLK